jgi:TonB family protein
MKLFLASLLLISQTEQLPEKWECGGDSESPAIEQLAKVKPGELKERVVSCAIPRLPGNEDAQGSVIMQVVIDEEGNVQCARVIHGQSMLRRAALDAAKKWKFKPLMVEGKAKPYISFLTLFVSWDWEESVKQCPKEKRRA